MKQFLLSSFDAAPFSGGKTFFFKLQSVLVPHHVLAVVTVSMTAGIVSSNKLAVYEEW